MTEEKLVREISRWDLAAITINTIIGAGIFGLPAKVHALIGSYSIFAFLACAVIIGFVVLCYAEVSSRFAATGGPYLYAREAFGAIVGFEVGWLYWIVRVATFAANCNLFVTYLGFFDRRFDDPSIRSAAITVVVLALAVINLIGVRQSAIASNIFTAGKLIPLILFSVVGLFFISPDNFHFDAVPEYGNFSGAVLLLLYAFVGFEMAVVLGGETKDPQHSVPFALLVAVGAVAVLYILIQVVSIGTLPNLSASERPLADAASTYMGYFGAGFITIGALISILGNLNVGILGSTRLLFAMSERGDLPLFLSQVHNRFRTPHLSIAVTITAMLLLTLYSSFLSALAIATITRLLVYATTCAALPVFRRRGDSPPARFKSPAGNIVVVLSLLLIIWLLTRVDLQKEALPIAVAGVIGLVIFAARRLLSRVKNV